MKIETVNKCIERIRASAGDPEAAHSMEDHLYVAVLRSIAHRTCDDPQGCAQAALEAQKIEFARWCA